MERKYFKAINFDLITKELAKYYPNKNPRQAYRDIKAFLVRHGFEHRQWSGYRSVQRMSNVELMDIVKALNERFPWLKQCVGKFDATNISKGYDLIKVFEDTELLNASLPEKKVSLKDKLSEAKEKTASSEPIAPNIKVNER